MSGDYTQRGIPAFMPKHERAKIALMEGADLVLELPLTYATGTAERFAYGAVSLLNRLGCVDYLSFGCENDDLEMLQAIADLLIDPPAQLAEQIDSFLKDGLSYPRARAMAVKSVMQSGNILESPNNILAVEYLKALKRQKSHISPVIIKRKGAGYHDTQPDSLGMSSASGIRNLFVRITPSQMHEISDTFDATGCTSPLFSDAIKEPFDELCRQVPDFAYQEMINQYEKTWPVAIDDFSNLLHYSILTNMNQEKMDHYSVFSTLTKKYGNPNALNPKKSTWENSKVIMALERPLALKYTDKIVADQIKNQALVDKTAMEKIREQFLEGL